MTDENNIPAIDKPITIADVLNSMTTLENLEGLKGSMASIKDGFTKTEQMIDEIISKYLGDKGDLDLDMLGAIRINLVTIIEAIALTERSLVQFGRAEIRERTSKEEIKTEEEEGKKDAGGETPSE